MKKIAIIDDEEDARAALRSLITSLCPDVEICGEANNVENAFNLIRQTSPHGILLDISMEDGTGFDLLDRFPNPLFQTIFITAYDEFAIKAFRYHALDYLLKPINPYDLSLALGRVKSSLSEDYSTRIQHLLESNRSQKINKITLSSQEGLIFLELSEILHLESDGSYTTFYTLNDGKQLIARPMKDFEVLLTDHPFFKVHQSHIVNISHIKKILREDGGFVLMHGGHKIPIARRRKEQLMQVLKNKLS